MYRFAPERCNGNSKVQMQLEMILCASTNWLVLLAEDYYNRQVYGWSSEHRVTPPQLSSMTAAWPNAKGEGAGVPMDRILGHSYMWAKGHHAHSHRVSSFYPHEHYAMHA
ncbi:unnamed protein product [Strongylus vulgaris]|uniref:Uncharacterized protein n=1 Tax=Strongylus vulgaris TaxID=40348 RepID=A0A3P7LJZ2_STRVU|nr:unnamed protein product [Strongylus vulgaris]